MINKTQIFHSKKGNIRNIILSKTGMNEIIYGASAINKQLPKHLKVHTEDYDILTNNPRKEAREVERALDKYFGGNYFKVEPAIYGGTFRVKSLVDGKVYADYSLLEGNVPYKIINGKKYITLSYAKKQKIKTLKDPQAKFRHAKDRDTLNRIRLAEKSRNIFSQMFAPPKRIKIRGLR